MWRSVFQIVQAVQKRISKGNEQDKAKFQPPSALFRLSHDASGRRIRDQGRLRIRHAEFIQLARNEVVSRSELARESSNTHYERKWLSGTKGVWFPRRYLPISRITGQVPGIDSQFPVT